MGPTHTPSVSPERDSGAGFSYILLHCFLFSFLSPLYFLLLFVFLLPPSNLCDQLCFLLCLHQDVTSNLLFVLTPYLLAISEEDIHYASAWQVPSESCWTLMIPDRIQVSYLANWPPLPPRDRWGPFGDHILVRFTRTRQGKITQEVLSCYVLRGFNTNNVFRYFVEKWAKLVEFRVLPFSCFLSFSALSSL